MLLLCAEPVVLEGDVPADGEFFTLPFEVTAGTRELEVRHDDLSSSNILDWGLFAPDGGFVGWGGGNSEPAVVGPDASSRSYRLTGLTPGTWRVLVGKALVTQTPAKYRVEVEQRTTPVLAPQTRNGWQPAVLATGARYYAGDLHVHSVESGDARASLDDIATLAVARGLDFVALSEHNTVTTLDFLGDAQARNERVLLVPSIEFTTYAGHMNVFGASRVPPFWFGLEGASFDAALADFGAQGGVPTINHPTLDLGTFCIGCAWRQPVSEGLKAIEVGVGGWDETGSLFDESALLYWETLASRGVHLTAVGGSDDHRAGAGLNQTQSAIGSPTTLVFADELSVAALKRGLLAGDTVVKLRGADDPMVTLSLPPGATRVGDTVLASAVEVTATVTGGAGHQLVWIENGVVARVERVDGESFTSRFALSAPDGRSARVRAEVRIDQQPRTVTSHLWLGERTGLPPVEVKKAAGCSATGLEGFLLLALMLLRIAVKRRERPALVLLALVVAAPRVSAQPISGTEPGSWGDPSRAAFTDPSARSILSGLNAVSFDGLAPGTTQVDFDGMAVLVPAHALFGPSTLSAAWSPDVVVGPGVASVEAGRSLGRRVSLLTRTAPPANTTRAVIRADLLHVGLFVERGLDDGSSLQGAVRFFTTPAVAGAALKGSILLGDYQLRWVQKLGTGELRTQVVGAMNSIALSVSGIPLAARLQNHQFDLRWRDGLIELGAGLHRTSIGLTLRGDSVNNAIDGAQDGLTLRAKVGGALNGHARGFVGADIDVRRLSLGRQTTLKSDVQATDATLRELGLVMLGGLFAEATLTEGEWHTTLGLRGDVWVPTQGGATVTADPRLTTRRRFGAVDFELGVGLTHQAPTWLVSVPVLESVALRYGVQELARGDLTVTLPLSADRQEFVSMHAFGAGLVRGLEFSPFDEDFLQLANQVREDVERHRAPGWMAGAELRSHLVLAPWWWLEVSYGYQQSWRQAVFSRYDEHGLPTGDDVDWVPWQHQQAHQLRAAVGFDFGSGWKLAVAGTFTSGAPMLGGLHAREQQPGTDSLTGAPRWVPKNRDDVGAAPGFLRADLRASKTWRPGAAEVELFLDVANLSASQPTGTSYGTAPATLEQQARGEVTLTTKNASSPLPPIPVLGLEVRL